MTRWWMWMVAGLLLVGCSSENGNGAAANDGPMLVPMDGPTGMDPPAMPPGMDGVTQPTGEAGAQAEPPVMMMPGDDAPPAMDDEPPAEPAGPQVPARDYFPTDGWQMRDPAEVGLDNGALDAAFDYAQESATQALLVIREGYIAREEYYRGFGMDQRHQSYSMAKSFTSGLIGIAIEQGLLPGADATFCTYYDEWDCADDSDPRSRVTLAHAMTLTSGLDWAEDWSAGLGAPNDAITMSGSPRPIDYVLAKSSAHEPGSNFQYSTGDPALLSGVLQSVTGMTALQYAQQEVFSKIGTGGIEWADDADGQTTTYAGMSATAREFAKYGFLYLNRGQWDGEQIVPESWVQVSTNPGESLSDWYGYLWHVNAPVKWNNPELPADGFAAIGVQGQHVIVIPSSDLIIVRLAADGFGGSTFDAGQLIEHVLNAIQ